MLEASVSLSRVCAKRIQFRHGVLGKNIHQRCAMRFTNLLNALEGVVARDLLEKRTFLQIHTHLDDGKMMGVEVG